MSRRQSSTIMLLITIAIVFVATVSASIYSPTVPCFFWSGQSYFSGHQSLPNVLTAQDISDIVSITTQQTPLATSASAWVSSASAETSPEVVIAFVNSELSSGSGSQASGAYSNSAQSRPSALKAALGGSVSSLSVPFVKLTSSAGNAVGALELITPLFQTVVRISLASSSCEAVVNEAIAHADVFSNGVADLIVITSDDAPATEACLNAVSSAVNRRTSGRYLALFTGEISASKATGVRRPLSALRPSFATQSLVDAQAAALHDASFVNLLEVSATVSNSTDTDTGPMYITPVILFGLFLGAILLFILLVGVCVTMSIQAPLRFAGPTQKLVIGKEH